VVNLHAKFEVSSSNRYRYQEGAKNFKSRLPDPSDAPWPNFVFFR